MVRRVEIIILIRTLYNTSILAEIQAVKIIINNMILWKQKLGVSMQIK
jgi:hypothetical protein